MSFLDHRQLSGEMELYFLDEQVGAGLPLWLPRGAAIRDELESFLKACEQARGYGRVASPHIARGELYERSGHLECFGENMFPPLEGDEKIRLRPMNCPHHHRIFASSPRSYRQLPFRIAEFGQVYRRENSGSLLGLSRVRGLCQNDAHIYIRPEQAADELLNVLKLFEHCYQSLGLSGYRYRLSLGDLERPQDFQGSPLLWRQSEELLRNSLRALGLPFFESQGEAAFYGPKIDVQMKIGRGQESVASVQLDFLAAERFGLEFAAPDGAKQRPWVIHRAPLGSHERFLAMLLEQYQGRFPGWLSPVQLLVIPQSESVRGFARELVAAQLECGVRAELDESAGSLSKRVRAAHRLRPLAILVLGAREAEGGRLSLRLRDNEVEELERCNLHYAMKRLIGPRPALFPPSISAS